MINDLFVCFIRFCFAQKQAVLELNKRIKELEQTRPHARLIWRDLTEEEKENFMPHSVQAPPGVHVPDDQQARLDLIDRVNKETAEYERETDRMLAEIEQQNAELGPDALNCQPLPGVSQFVLPLGFMPPPEPPPHHLSTLVFLDRGECEGGLQRYFL